MRKWEIPDKGMKCMATNKEFIDYVCEQLQGIGDIRSRKMFGEYMVYINNKPIVLVCENTVYIKKHDCLEELMKEADKGNPYNGAKEHYILDIDNRDLCNEVIRIVEPLIEIPKPRKSKNSQ